MTATVVITVTASTPTLLPPGLTSGQLRFAILDTANPPAVVISTTNDGPAATFTSVAPGSYTAQVDRLASDGSVVGAPVTQSFSVPTPASADVPTTITVTLS